MLPFVAAWSSGQLTLFPPGELGIMTPPWQGLEEAEGGGSTHRAPRASAGRLPLRNWAPLLDAWARMRSAFQISWGPVPLCVDGLSSRSREPGGLVSWALARVIGQRR